MTGLLLFLYDLLWTLASLAVLPLAPLLRSTPLAQRLGLALPPKRGGRPALWIHALSVGEVLSAVPLVLGLKERHPTLPLVLTVGTVQGLSMARKKLEGKADRILRMPLDARWPMHRLVDRIRPALFIVVETDLWPGLLNLLARRRVPSLLVNGRISPRTYEGYRRYRHLVRPLLFGTLERCLMQSEVDRERLLSIGVPPLKIVTAGNLKFDREWDPMSQGEREALLKSLGLGREDALLVAGSTHPGEEEVLLRVFGRLRPFFPSLRLILAPRRIERGQSVHRSALAEGLKSDLRTEAQTNPGVWDVLVLNTLGELGRVYGLARIAFVGGSLVPVGGHNLLEPAAFGRPVLFGPHMHNFLLMSRLLLEKGGGRMVSDEEETFEAMRQLLSSPSACETMGRRAMEFVEANRGALKRILDQIDAYLRD